MKTREQLLENRVRQAASTESAGRFYRSIDPFTISSDLARLRDHVEGFTFCPSARRCLVGGERINPDIYVVSIKGFERRFRNFPLETEFRHWVLSALPALRLAGSYVGLWRDGLVFVLDVSFLIRGFQQAWAFGKANAQTSIFHLASKTCHPII